METPREYVERINSQIEEKKGRLDEMLANYETLMESPRTYSPPISNSVYNSNEASHKLKEAMRTRKLNGMTQEDFENEYKRILHGINNLEASTGDKSKTTEIVKADNLDIVPTSIDRITAIEAGHTQGYILRKCGEYGITRAQLEDMIHLKKKHHTLFPTILRIIDRGYSIEDAAELLETRELCEGDENAPSLTKIMALQQRFNIPADSEMLSHAVEMIRERIGTLKSGDEEYIDSAISKVLHMAKRMNTGNLETVINFMTDSESILSENAGEY